MRMGIRGTGLAGVFMNLVIMIIQFTYANTSIPELKDVLHWPNAESVSLDRLISYLRLGASPMFI